MREEIVAHGKREPQDTMNAYRARLDELYRQQAATDDEDERARLQREIERIDGERMDELSVFIRRLREQP